MATSSEFWAWFRENQAAFLNIQQAEETERQRLLNDLLAHLQQYSEGLYFEMGPKPGEKMELVISAEGIEKFFPAVETLVADAPEMEGWMVTAFKQPKSGFVVQYQERSFDPDEIWFMPLENEEDPSLVGLRICHEDYDDTFRDVFLGGTFLMLDSLIGERSTTLDIDYLEVGEMPEGVEKEHLVQMNQLKNFIDYKKNRQLN